MPDDSSAPLLGNENSESSRSPSRTSNTSRKSSKLQKAKSIDRSVHSAESTPLLSRDPNHRTYDERPDSRRNGDEATASAAASSLGSIEDEGSVKRTWKKPTIFALVLLLLLFLTILGIGFAAPAVVEEYADEALDFVPTALSVVSFTSSGVRVRIQGDFTLDASKVRRKPVRDLGRFGTWIVSAVESRRTQVRVYVPEYGNILLGVADVPPVVVDVRNGHTTRVDFLSDLIAGDLDGVRHIANDWLNNRLGSLRVQGVADVGLKSGLFSFGTKHVSKSLVFTGKSLYSLRLPQSTAVNKLNRVLLRSRFARHSTL